MSHPGWLLSGTEGRKERGGHLDPEGQLGQEEAHGGEGSLGGWEVGPLDSNMLDFRIGPRSPEGLRVQVALPSCRASSLAAPGKDGLCSRGACGGQGLPARPSLFP